MSDVSSLPPSALSLGGAVTGVGALSPRSTQPSLPVQGERPSGAWFDGLGTGLEADLQAVAEPQARGLSASQHAERVLGHLIA